jgi:hypothetical protein
VDVTEYRRIIGCLRYLIHTRPDLAFLVGVASRYMEKPTIMHMQAVKKIIRYLKGTTDFELVYTLGEEQEVLAGYSDSDIGADLGGRRSTSSMAFYLNESLVTWCSQNQKTVDLSSYEVEFMAAIAVAMQALWLRNMFSKLTATKPLVVPLYVDNNSTISLMKNLVFHGRSKHTDIKYHFIRQCVERGLIMVRRIGTNEQRADSLTKALVVGKLAVMRHLLGVTKICAHNY